MVGVTGDALSGEAHVLASRRNGARKRAAQRRRALPSAMEGTEKAAMVGRPLDDKRHRYESMALSIAVSTVLRARPAEFGE